VSLFWTVLALALVGACIAGLNNVFRDDLDVVHLAEAAACEGEAKACNVQRVFWERGPLSETFEFVTPRMEQVRVRCTRKDVLVGDYSCEVRERRPFQQVVPAVQGPAGTTRQPKGIAKGRTPATPATASAMPVVPGSAAADRPGPQTDGGAD
jgi:hypothetical protein